MPEIKQIITVNLTGFKLRSELPFELPYIFPVSSRFSVVANS